MERLLKWITYHKCQFKKSFIFAWYFVGGLSVLCTISGYSVNDIVPSFSWFRKFFVLLVIYLVSVFFSFIAISILNNKKISMVYKNMHIYIQKGDIFATEGLKVIGCDTRFSTQIDDVVINKNSLHGKLFLQYGDISEIETVVEKRAQDLKLQRNQDGSYDFPLGTIIKYESSKNNNTYLLLALARLDENNKAKTNFTEFETTLFQMWKEIDAVYAQHDIVLPLLGGGILRFEEGKEVNNLLKCMICTLKHSQVDFNTNIKIVLFEDKPHKIWLYEHKGIFSQL